MAWKALMRREHYEVDESMTGEAGLRESLILCGKNPGHKNFRRIVEFSEEDLPSNCRDEDILKMIKAQAAITVRVSAKKDNNNSCEPSSARQGISPSGGNLDNLKTGTGWVYQVKKSPESDNQLCECETCKSSGQPQRLAGEIGIKTAAHVVHSTYVTCHFDYDSPETNLEQVPTLSGMEIMYNDRTVDWCKMNFMTHDKDFLERIYNVWSNFKDLLTRVSTKYEKGHYDSDGSKPKLTVIVSHPHGCEKQVAIGRWIDRLETPNDAEMTQYTYNTPTCPGCSGALVNILGRSRFQCCHPHFGTTEITELNLSGAALDKKAESLPLLEDFHLGGVPNLKLKDLVHHVMEFAEDERGAPFIVEQLEHATDAEKALVLQEIQDAYFLMINEHGHQVFAKLFEVGSDVQKRELAERVRRSFLRLASDEHGSKVIQKAFESMAPDTKIKCVKELPKHVIEYVKDPYGNCVVQWCLKTVDCEHLQFVFDDLKGKMSDLSTDEHSSQFVQYILKHCPERLQDSLLEELYEKVFDLAQDCYGAKVIQCLLTDCPESIKAQVLGRLTGHLVTLAEDQEGHNIIQYALQHCTVEQRRLIFEELLGHSVRLAQDKFGSDVIQCMLKHCEQEQRDSIVNTLREYQAAPSQNRCWNKVMQCITELGYR